MLTTEQKKRVKQAIKEAKEVSKSLNSCLRAAKAALKDIGITDNLDTITISTIIRNSPSVLLDDNGKVAKVLKVYKGELQEKTTWTVPQVLTIIQRVMLGNKGVAYTTNKYHLELEGTVYRKVVLLQVKTVAELGDGTKLIK